MTCTGCPHQPHRGACGYTTEPGTYCGCAIVTLDLRTEEHRMLDLLVARTEYLVNLVIEGHEAVRHVREALHDLRVTLDAHMLDEGKRLARLESLATGNGASP